MATLVPSKKTTVNLKVDLSAGTVFPVTLKTFAAGQRVTTVELYVDTAFDGAAKFAVGMSGDEEMLFGYDDGVPVVAGIYETTPGLKMAGGEIVQVFAQGAPTVGSATLIVHYE